MRGTCAFDKSPSLTQNNKMTTLTKKGLIKKINSKLRKKTHFELECILSEISKKRERDNTQYEQVPAKIKVEGKTYHTLLFRPKINTETWIPILKEE